MSGRYSTRQAMDRHAGTLAIEMLERRPDDHISDIELLEITIRAIGTSSDPSFVAKALIDRFFSYSGVLAAPLELLIEVLGVDRDLAARLRLAKYAAQRFARDRVTFRSKPLSSWADLIDYFTAAIAYEPIEHLRVIFLDRKNQLIADEEQGRGGVDHVRVYTGEILRRALLLRATALIVVHNHPSGDPAPSVQDIQMTRELVTLGKPLGITVHDHVIVGRHGYKSLKRMGLLEVI